MDILAYLRSIFSIKTAKCSEITLNDADDKLGLEDEELLEEREHHLPSYRMLMMPIRNILLDSPGIQLNGFLFSFSLPLSQQFSINQEISMSPKKPGRDAGPIPETYLGGKMPFYTLGAQYHHGDFSQKNQNHQFSLVGRIDSQGQVQTIFFKPIGKKTQLRVIGAFPNSNPDLAQYETEIESQYGNSKYGFIANMESIDCNFIQKLGSRVLLGTQLTYMHMTRMFSNSFFLRLNRTPLEKYYLQISELSKSLSLSVLSRIDDKTSLATDFQIVGDSLETTAGLGYRRKSKNFEVNSSIRTNGDMKSFFSYSMHQAFKLKLFLSGNLFHDDFKTGYSISVGPSEE